MGIDKKQLTLTLANEQRSVYTPQQVSFKRMKKRSV